MNDTTLAFQLSLEEAFELDNIFLEAKSFKKQIEVFQSLNNRPIDHQLYYVNTLVEELVLAKKFEEINKYLKALLKEEVDPTLLIVWLKVVFVSRHNISEYSNFQRTCCGIFLSKNLDYEQALAGFL